MIFYSVPNEASSTFTININNEVYNIDLRWMDRTQAWYITISKNTIFIVTNMKIIPNVNITRRDPTLLPDGILIVSSKNPVSKNIGRDNFGSGKDYELIYVSDIEFGL